MVVLRRIADEFPAGKGEGYAFLPFEKQHWEQLLTASES